MHVGAISHSPRRLKPLTIAVMTIALLGQVSAVSHEAAVRHVRCAEHGEMTHVAFSGTPVVMSRAPASIGSNEAQASDGHEHCSAAFTVRGGARPVVLRTVARYTPPESAVRVARSTPAQRGRLFVLASAPKTSPPSA